MKHQVTCVVGTRPEAIKMAPVVLRLKRAPSHFEVRLVSTGQHRELLSQALAEFDLIADEELDVMQPGQELAELTATMLVKLSKSLRNQRPDFVLAQGDTTTVLATSLACRYERIPFGHVEAGLRSGSLNSPFPEELNRVLTSRMADLHFAPTAESRRHLVREGVPRSAIHVTGNTGIDALLQVAGRDLPLPLVPPTERFILVTTHRRENWGKSLEQICLAVHDLVNRNADLSVVLPMHPNPKVREVIQGLLSHLPQVRLIEPLGYADFVGLTKRCEFLLTDSGGLQEEGPTLGKHVLVLRSETERPEAISAGFNRLVGTTRAGIVSAVEEAWHAQIGLPQRPTAMYGDGRAATRIVRTVKRFLELAPDRFEVARATPN